MADRDAFVKYKTLALPQALFRRHRFKVFEDAALQVVDILVPVHAQQGGGFFAADAASAKHGNFGFFAACILARTAWRLQGAPGLFLRRHPGRQVGKGLDIGVDGPGKRADFHFVIIAGVDQHHVGLGDQGIPVLRCHVVTGHQGRADAWHAQRDDFLLQAHLHAQKRRLTRP